MDLSLEPRPVLAVCLHTAWQKTLMFESLSLGAVNRAVSRGEAGGGKGVNVARVFRLLGLPVAVAGFAGGWSGEKLRRELSVSGIMDLTVWTRGCTRCCYTVIDHEGGQATELIEPSEGISAEESKSLMELLAARMGEFGAVAICGSMAPGIPEDAYVRIADLARQHGLPVILDSVSHISGVLEGGVRLLKINGDECCQFMGMVDPAASAEELLRRYPRVEWLAVTRGGEPGMLFSAQGRWRVALPKLEKVVSPIGGGDCATAIMARRIAEGWNGEIRMTEAFGEALACASASCLTQTPSVFDGAVAARLRGDSRIERF